MADNVDIVQPPTGVPTFKVATDEAQTINGVAQVDPKPQIERVKAGFGADGDFNDPSDANGFPIKDVTPSVSVLNVGSGTATASAVQLVGANADRSRVDIMHAGLPSGSRVWLGIGGPPTPGSGYFLDPGSFFSEYLKTSIQVQLDVAAPSGSEPVTFVEVK